MDSRIATKVRWYSALVAVAMSMAAGVASARDFQQDAREAGERVPELQAKSSELLIDGKFDEATNVFLDAYPGEAMTPGAAFIFGNVLYEIDPDASYELHELAAKAMPNEPPVQLEWAMQLHRADEWEAAIDAYDVFIKSYPSYAIGYGIKADCLLRLGKIDEAIVAWKQSEASANGSIEQFESLVCAVNRQPRPDKHRAELLKKVIDGKDQAAAAELIAIDCLFPYDWWNVEPNTVYLEHDVKAVLEALELGDADVLGRAIACVGELVAAEMPSADQARAIFEKHQLLLDEAHTLPEHPALASILLGQAELTKAMSREQLEQQFAKRMLAKARETGDAELWNVAIHFGPTSKDEMLALEKEAWTATGDERFITARMMIRHKNGDLKSDDPELAEALEAFPLSAEIWAVAIAAATDDKTLTRDVLVKAAIAEFEKFSSFASFATVVNRPRAMRLRQYFAQMQQVAE